MPSLYFKSLVETAHDSVVGYQNALAVARHPLQRSQIKELLENRRDTLAILIAELKASDGTYKSEGSGSEEIQAFWRKVSNKLEHGDDEAGPEIAACESFLAAKFDEALSSGVMSVSETQAVEAALINVLESKEIANSMSSKRPSSDS